MRFEISFILRVIDWIADVVLNLLPLLIAAVIITSVVACSWFAHENTRLERELSLEHAKFTAALGPGASEESQLRVWEAEREWMRREAAKR